MSSNCNIEYSAFTLLKFLLVLRRYSQSDVDNLELIAITRHLLINQKNKAFRSILLHVFILLAVTVTHPVHFHGPKISNIWPGNQLI